MPPSHVQSLQSATDGPSPTIMSSKAEDRPWVQSVWLGEMVGVPGRAQVEPWRHMTLMPNANLFHTAQSQTAHLCPSLPNGQ